jgi:ABC-type uncharacterized transport system ATPase subunit
MIFLKFKQIMSFDITNIQFLINSCELKVHPKNKCLNVSISLQKAHVYVLEILYLNIKILTGRIS